MRQHGQKQRDTHSAEDRDGDDVVARSTARTAVDSQGAHAASVAQADAAQSAPHGSAGAA